MATALAPYLRASPRYAGIDVWESAIRWCQREIEPRWRQSHFRVVDANNGSYNPAGALVDDGFRFPFDDAEFDFVMLLSVFTHMLPDAMAVYLREIRRVLKPSSRSFITFFLVNTGVRDLIAQGRSDRTFQHPAGDGCFAELKDKPEEAVAFEERVVRERFAAAGREIQDPVRPGRWSGAHRDQPYQDTVVAVRR